MLFGLSIILTALLLDRCLGEPKHHHPLVGFGLLAQRIERDWNQQKSQRWHGVVAWLLCVGTISVASYLADRWLQSMSAALHWLGSACVLYLAIGWQSLKEHMQAIHCPLAQGDLHQARQACAMVVSRDTESLNGQEVAKAAVESTLENGCDGIFAAIFWFAVLGIPGVVLYRLSNTLDAMWGYRTERYQSFGWWSAKIDDWLNWIPARITALIYTLTPLLCGNPNELANRFSRNEACRRGWRHWQEQAPLLASPNGGPVMVTGATVLDLRLGGPTAYHGCIMDKPLFGGDQPPAASDIPRALTLIDHTLVVWVIAGTLLCGAL